MTKYKSDNFERISKTKAFIRFCNNLPVYFCPVKLHPESPWQLSVQISSAEWIEEEWQSANCDYHNYNCPMPSQKIIMANAFSNAINNFNFYNCNLNETGFYPAFYIPLN